MTKRRKTALGSVPSGCRSWIGGFFLVRQFSLSFDDTYGAMCLNISWGPRDSARAPEALGLSME